MADDISLELTDEEKAAWQQFSGAWHYGYIKTLAHALQKQVAAAMKAEWFASSAHDDDDMEYPYIVYDGYWDRENWTNAQWFELAGRRLRGEKNESS